MITARLLASLDGRGRIFLGVLALLAVVIPLLNLLLPPSSFFHVPGGSTSCVSPHWPPWPSTRRTATQMTSDRREKATTLSALLPVVSSGS